MYCPECGKLNDDSAVRCSHCSALMREESQQITINVNEIKDKATAITKLVLSLLKKYKLIVVPLIAIIIAIGAFFAVGNHIADPDRLVDNYMEAYKDENYKALYDLLDISDSEFVNKQALAEYMEKNVKEKIERYEKPRQSASAEGSLVKEYSVSYTAQGSSQVHYMNLTLVRKDKNILFFFPQYKIANYDIAATYSIRTVEGATVKVEGVSIEPSKEDPNNYYIGNLLNGWTYSYTITHPEYVKKTGSFSTERHNNVIRVTEMEPTAAAKISLATLTKENWEKICAAARDEMSFDSIDIEYFDREDIRTDLADDYSRLCDKFNDDGGLGVQQLSFSEYTNVSGEYAAKDDMTYRCSLDFDYTYVYTRKNWNNEIVTDTATEPEDGNIAMYYKYSDGKWILQSIADYSIYF